jgi:hypothetical protein
VKITEVARTIGLLFSPIKVVYYFSQKTDEAVFWAIFSQTHPVTLVPTLKLVAFELNLQSTPV